MERFLINTANNDLSTEQAYIYGIFSGCGLITIDNSWEIHNSNKDLLINCKEMLEQLENIPFKILDTNELSSDYKLVPCNDDNNLVKKYKTKKVLNEILNSNNTDILNAFKYGLVDSNNNNRLRIEINNQVIAQSYVLLFQLLNYNVFL